MVRGCGPPAPLFAPPRSPVSPSERCGGPIATIDHLGAASAAGRPSRIVPQARSLFSAAGNFITPSSPHHLLCPHRSDPFLLPPRSCGPFCAPLSLPRNWLVVRFRLQRVSLAGIRSGRGGAKGSSAGVMRRCSGGRPTGEATKRKAEAFRRRAGGRKALANWDGRTKEYERINKRREAS